MLVLALQFSKGVARRWQFVWYTTPSTPPAVERTLVPCERDAPSKRKRRQDPASSVVKRETCD
jgi:hypothetical protein